MHQQKAASKKAGAGERTAGPPLASTCMDRWFRCDALTCFDSRTWNAAHWVQLTAHASRVQTPPHCDGVCTCVLKSMCGRCRHRLRGRRIVAAESHRRVCVTCGVQDSSRMECIAGVPCAAESRRSVRGCCVLIAGAYGRAPRTAVARQRVVLFVRVTCANGRATDVRYVDVPRAT